MRISVGSDHRGVQMKARLLPILEQLGHTVADEGAHDTESIDYPDIAAVVARKVAHGEAERGILICGSGIGVSIAANKFPNVRAANCHDEFEAEMSRRHNDANVLCLSSHQLAERNVDHLVALWLSTEFEGGRHARRVEKIHQLENAAHCKE